MAKKAEKVIFFDSIKLWKLGGPSYVDNMFKQMINFKKGGHIHEV